MGRYRKIDSRIWNDEKFCSLTDQGKLCFFYILTHPHMTSLGAMRSSIPGLASEICWAEKAFREAFGEAFRKGMLEIDEKSSFIGVPNFLKYNGPESPNVVKSWAASLDLIPECKAKTQLIERVKGFLEALPKAFREALPEAFAKGMPNPEQEQEQDPYQEQKPEQLKALCAEQVDSLSVITIPLNTGKEYPIRECQVQEWQILYPGIDVNQELRNYRGWTLANPKKRKTQRGILSSINFWLSDKQNKAGRNGNGSGLKETLDERNRQTVQQAMSMEDSHES